jgi:arginine/ornithine N-succinyltransferase beta subunit
MKQKFKVTMELDKALILEKLVEKLANANTSWKNQKIRLPRGWQVMETSSTESYVSGFVNFVEIGIHMPFVSSHLFTCTKASDDSYYISWSTSLS